jgi:hypothetical protein
VLKVLKNVLFGLRRKGNELKPAKIIAFIQLTQLPHSRVGYSQCTQYINVVRWWIKKNETLGYESACME